MEGDHSRPRLQHAVVVGDEPHKGCDVCDARAEAERLRTVLRDYFEVADWYRRVWDRQPVRGLDEAKVRDALREVTDDQ